MKISIVSDIGYPFKGGAEVYVHNLGENLVKLGNEVHWIYSKLPKTKKYEIINGIQCHRVYVPFEKKHTASRNFFCLTMFPRVLKVAKKVDILQFNTFIAGTTGWIAGKLSGKPYLLMVHELFRELWSVLPVSKIEKILYPIMEEYMVRSPYPFFIVPSKYTKNELINLGISEKIISVIYHGIEHDIFHKGYKPILKRKFKIFDRKIIGWYGRIGLSYSKNLKCLLESYKLIKKDVPEAVLFFGGEDFEKIIPTIKELGLEINKDIFYCGSLPREKIPFFYSSCDVFAIPSLSEGFGFIAVVAEACGVPVVCFNKGALPEVVKDMETGIVVKKTSPEDFADGIIKILTNDKLKKKFSENGPKWVKQFDWRKSAMKHLKVYNKLISNF